MSKKLISIVRPTSHGLAWTALDPERIETDSKKLGPIYQSGKDPVQLAESDPIARISLPFEKFRMHWSQDATRVSFYVPETNSSIYCVNVTSGNTDVLPSPPVSDEFDIFFDIRNKPVCIAHSQENSIEIFYLESSRWTSTYKGDRSMQENPARRWNSLNTLVSDAPLYIREQLGCADHPQASGQIVHDEQLSKAFVPYTWGIDADESENGNLAEKHVLKEYDFSTIPLYSYEYENAKETQEKNMLYTQLISFGSPVSNNSLRTPVREDSSIHKHIYFIDHPYVLVDLGMGTKLYSANHAEYLAAFTNQSGATMSDFPFQSARASFWPRSAPRSALRFPSVP